MKTNLAWNYECIRDFAGSFVGANSKNEKLMSVLPEAVNKFAKELATENNTNFEDEKSEIIKMIINNDNMIDYRTGIDCKNVIIDCLLNSRQPTEEELAAILDVIYIDSISSRLEGIAIEIINPLHMILS